MNNMIYMLLTWIFFYVILYLNLQSHKNIKKLYSETGFLQLCIADSILNTAQCTQNITNVCLTVVCTQLTISTCVTVHSPCLHAMR